MENKQIKEIEIEKYKKFFKGLGRLLDVMGLLGIVAAILLFAGIVFDFFPYMGKYSQINFIDVVLGAGISSLITFLGVKIGKHDFLSKRYLVIASIIIFPLPFFGFVGGLGAILWVIFIIQSIRGFFKIRELKNNNKYEIVFSKNIPQNKLSGDISNKNSKHVIGKTIKISSVKNLSFIVVLILIFTGIPFYWFAIRPSQIKKGCSWVLVRSYTQEEKNLAKKYLEGNCPVINSVADKVIWNYNRETISQECIKNMDMQYAPLGNGNVRRSANDAEYNRCIREKGL
jgi:hypothetical protein